MHQQNETMNMPNSEMFVNEDENGCRFEDPLDAHATYMANGFQGEVAGVLFRQIFKNNMLQHWRGCVATASASP